MYGVRGLPLAWFRSYLRDRQSYVRIGNASSSIQTINIGVPQGSILGPILFLVYINDLPNVSRIFNTCFFADDTTFSNSDCNSDNLAQSTNSELDKVFEWTLANRLTINVEKTEIILFSNRNFDYEVNPIKLNHETLNFSNCCKFLGVFIDSKLTFKDHISFVASKLPRGACILYRIRGRLPIEGRLNYYYAMLYPYLSYSSLVWGNTYMTHLVPIITQQKRIIRIIAGEGGQAHCDPLFVQFGLLKVEDIIKYQLLCYMFRKVHNEGDVYPIHNYNTRNAHLQRPSLHRLTGTQHAISFMGPSLWNGLPARISGITGFFRFKRSLKAHFLSSYDSY